MKNILIILFFIPSFIFAQTTNIPDPNFEQALIDLGYDNIMDGSVLTATINSVQTLSIAYKNINDLTGIQEFTDLVFFYCGYNNLTSLDVSNNLELQTISCENNMITSLDLSNNPYLSTIICRNNELVYLNAKNGNNYNINFWSSVNNPDLTCIEVDDPSWSSSNWFYYDWNWANFDTNCPMILTDTISECDSVLIHITNGSNFCWSNSLNNTTQGTWNNYSSAIATSVNIDMTFDNNNNLYLGSNNGIVHKYECNNWINVGSNLPPLDHFSMDIDNNNILYTAFQDFSTGYGISVMKFDGNNWNYVGTPSFSSGYANFTTIALDNYNTPYVAFLDMDQSDRISVMKFNGTDWDYVGNPGFSNNYAGYISLVFDQNNSPWVSFIDWPSAVNNGTIDVMQFDGNSWISKAGINSSLFYQTQTKPDLIIDNNNIPHIAFTSNSSA